MFNVYFIRLASSLVNIISDVVSLFICVLIICSKYSTLLKRETMKMILLRKFRFLILMVFLIACSMHIMIDLLPKLERHPDGGGGGEGGCSCSHTPSEEPRSWAKHTLRILQDFSNEPSSNVSSHSLERLQGARDKTQGARKTAGHAGQSLDQQQQQLEQQQQQQRGDRKRQFIHGGSVGKNGPARGSRLAALYEHPLYKRAVPPLTDEDTLFNVNTDIRFDPKAAEDEAW